MNLRANNGMPSFAWPLPYTSVSPVSTSVAQNGSSGGAGSNVQNGGGGVNYDEVSFLKNCGINLKSCSEF